MIDDEFQPSFDQLETLGHLFAAAQNNPCFPILREHELYEMQFGGVLDERPEWIEELVEIGLIDFLNRMGGPLPPPIINSDGPFQDGVALTTAGVYYCLSRPQLFADQQFGLTGNLPSNAIDAIWAVHNHYAPPGVNLAPASDRPVTFDHNTIVYQEAVESLESVVSALSADNEIGAHYPAMRDRKLEELLKIREALEKGAASQSRLTLMAWGVFGYLMTQFADRPVGHLADLAWTAFKRLIGFS